MDKEERRLTNNEYIHLTEYEKLVLTKLNRLEKIAEFGW